MKATLTFLRSINKPSWFYKILGLFFLNIIWGIISILEPEVLRRGTMAISNQDLPSLWGVAWLAAFTGVSLIIVKTGMSMLRIRVENQCQHALSYKLSKSMIDSQTSSISGHKFGDISTIVINNAIGLSGSAINMVMNFSQGVMAMATALIYMAVLEWRLMACLVIYHILYRLLTLAVLGKLKRNTAEVISAEKDSGNLLSSMLSNMISVRMATSKEFLGSMVRLKETLLLKKRVKEFTWANALFDSVWACSKVAEFAIIFGVGALVLFPGEVPLSILLAFIFAEDIFNNGTYWFNNFLGDRARVLAQMESINPVKDSEKEQGLHVEVEDKDISIRFEDVSFGYGDNLILRDVSFTIKPLDKVLIKGGNGQGKSTLLKLITGLYRPCSGKIYFGDADTSIIHLDELSKCYAYISQFSNILDGDVRENIALTGTYDFARTDEVLALLGLYECINTPPTQLSQGEKQRLNIGRGIYKSRHQVLIGDEIFANIDNENRSKIIKLINELYQDHTVIMIAHESIDYPFNRVLNVENGKVLEEGVTV